jgi:hypothetical protein
MEDRPDQPPEEAEPGIGLMGDDSRHGAHARSRAAEGMGDSLSDVAGHLSGT